MSEKKEKEIFQGIGQRYWWVNEESTAVLNRGYLLQGETIESAINRITNSVSEWYNGFKGKNKKYYASVFKEIIEKGWLSMSSPIWSNEGTTRGLSISCVTGDTWINTKQGAKLAKDIIIGDELLTHKNRFRKVTNIIPTKNREDIWKLKVSTRPSDIFITGDHLVLTNLGWVRVDNLNPEKHMVAVNGKIEYDASDYVLDLSEFVKYDFIIEDNLIKKISTNKDEYRKNKFNKEGDIITSYSQPYSKIPITMDLAWAFGIWFAEGNIMGGTTNTNGIKITMHENELPLVEKWVDIMKKHFNLNGKSWLQTHKNENKKTPNIWSNGCINSVVLGNYFASFGKGCKIKQIPEYILNLPTTHLEQFLMGMLEGDGSLRKDGSYKITLSNPILISQIYQIGLKLGWDMSLQMNDKVSYEYNGVKNSSHVYTIMFRNYSLKTSKFNINAGVKFNDGLIYCPIREVMKTDKIEDVYDFTVDEDHSFSACGVVLHNCFGMSINDSISGISNKLSETIMQTKLGAGTSGYFGNLRGRGAAITNNGVSSGSVSFMELFNTTMNVVSQGSTRRGSFAAYLDIDHPDIEEFLTIKDISSPIQNLFYGVCVPDYWMKTMINEEGTYPEETVKQYRKIWSKVLESRQFKGLPYIFFTDNVNKNKPNIWKIKDEKITHSNLCISGNDRIVSNKGYLTAKQLFENGEELILFNGNIPVNSTPVLLRRKNEDVYKITLNNGMEHTVTWDHQINIIEGYSMDKKTKEYIIHRKKIPVGELKIGDKVITQNTKGIFGDYHNPELAYLLGYYQGDGTGTQNQIHICIWENNFDKESELQRCINKVYEDNKGWQGNNHKNLKIPHFFDSGVSGKFKKKTLITTLLKKLDFKKHVIPDWIWQSNEETQWNYIKGLLETDGTGYYNKKADNIEISYACNNNEYLMELQKLWYNLGIKGSIYCMSNRTKQILPDGKGGWKEYNTKPCYKLACSNKNHALLIEEKIGFLSNKGVNLPLREYRDNTKKYSKVKSIEYIGKEDVYCPTTYHPDHNIICNGILTGQCSEISIPDSDKESFVCCLSSMNLELFDQWYNLVDPETGISVVGYAHMFLDGILSGYLKKLKILINDGESFLIPSYNSTKKNRPTGLGVLGYHSYLQKIGRPFEHPLNIGLNKKIFGYLKEETDKMSIELGKEYGYAPIFDNIEEGNNGIIKERNVVKLAIAPTTSSSAILGQVSPGIEPFTSNFYKVNLAKGNFIRKNKYLDTLLNKKLEQGIIKSKEQLEDLWTDIMVKQGSVQHISEDILSKEEKDIFKTFKEISQYEIIVQASERQKYIDQSQSLNLNIPPNTPPKEVNKLIIEAWKRGIKTLYYQRSQSVSKELLSNIVSCISCEG